ncbi:MAG: alpha-galactosidase [Planctomycetota bacterium]|jgi:alpha-galactosidase|nr:alpha-galactosidase [Planctomycetota bacterium]
MTTPSVHADINCGAITARYLINEDSGAIGLQLIPTAKLDQVVERRTDLLMEPEIRALPEHWHGIKPWAVDPLVQVCCKGDGLSGGFAQGLTMRGAGTTGALKFVKQEVDKDKDSIRVNTLLENETGLRARHVLNWHQGDSFVRVHTVLINSSEDDRTIDMVSSFNLSGVTPFAPDAACDRLVAHRFRSAWSVEGRLISEPIEQLELERSWSGHGVRCERFGQIGSMPVRGWFPACAVEDTQAGVTWGAHLAWSGSWQLELYRRDDCLSVSGGLADHEFGHWRKTLTGGERLTTPTAILTVVVGDVDDCCHALVQSQNAAANEAPASEQDLPILFNEWCTTWGDPSHDNLCTIADTIKDLGLRYLVIDAGWYRPEQGDWGSAHGDWNPSPALFPDGLAATAAAIRERGLIPGLWFEMETIGPTSEAYGKIDRQLQRDGVPVTAGGRRFWDLRQDECHDYLAEKVIARLRDDGFGYIKVDYNETIGLGADDPDSVGEGLRQHVLGVHRFFRRMRSELPDLVIENCSSGGHRLEPLMLGLTAMSSFSDAHEGRDIPIVAANLHRLMLPRQSQIWAVLHGADDQQRLHYSLAATMLGRMCLSGDIWTLDAKQMDTVRSATAFYQQAAPIIAHGRSHRFGPAVTSYRAPKGHQVMLRESADGSQALLVAHGFAKAPGQVSLELPSGKRWTVRETFADLGSEVYASGTKLTLGGLHDWTGMAAILEC